MGSPARSPGASSVSARMPSARRSGRCPVWTSSSSAAARRTSPRGWRCVARGRSVWTRHPRSSPPRGACRSGRASCSRWSRLPRSASRCRTLSFDLAFSEYGASLWADPRLWVPEAARLLRPGGRLVFLTNSVLAYLCSPDVGMVMDGLQRPQFGMYRSTGPRSWASSTTWRTGTGSDCFGPTTSKSRTSSSSRLRSVRRPIRSTTTSAPTGHASGRPRRSGWHARGASEPIAVCRSWTTCPVRTRPAAGRADAPGGPRSPWRSRRGAAPATGSAPRASDRRSPGASWPSPSRSR